MRRVRGALASVATAALVAVATGPLPARAGNAPLRVLVWAPVADAARTTMSQALWTKDVDAYVGGNAIPFAGPGDPSVADCRAAHADYAVSAPFDLRPNLPGMPNAAGRVAARTHLVVTNCITGSAVLDRAVFFESDAPSQASDGDYDSVPEITWARGVPSALARTPLVFERVARVISVTTPLALIDIKLGRVRVGDGLRDFARADRSVRTAPIVLTVTQVFDRYLEVMFSGNGDRPSVGDLVEPLAQSPASDAGPAAAARPQAAGTPKPTPTR